jgi:hypothetical protein
MAQNESMCGHRHPFKLNMYITNQSSSTPVVGLEAAEVEEAEEGDGVCSGAGSAAAAAGSTTPVGAQAAVPPASSASGSAAGSAAVQALARLCTTFIKSAFAHGYCP